MMLHDNVDVAIHDLLTEEKENPSTPGSKYGLSPAFATEVLKVSDARGFLKILTRTEAAQIIRAFLWERHRLGQLPFELAKPALFALVNIPTTKVFEMLAEAVNESWGSSIDPLPLDGVNTNALALRAQALEDPLYTAEIFRAKILAVYKDRAVRRPKDYGEFGRWESRMLKAVAFS